MEPAPELLPSTSLEGSTLTTTPAHRIATYLREAGLSPPKRILCVTEVPPWEPVDGFEASLPHNTDAARSLLVRQRLGEHGSKQPEQKTRRAFWTSTHKDLQGSQDAWIFTKHEVAKQFNSLVSGTPLAPPGIAQALLSHVSGTSLDELWCHLHDPKLEKRTKTPSKRSRLSVKSEVQLDRISTGLFKKSKVTLTPETSWLDQGAALENADYVHLMCQAGVGQDVVDRAFIIALSKHSMDVMKVLVGFGAQASSCQNIIREYVIHGNIALVKLLLSSRTAMTVEAWRYCIEPECEDLAATEKQSPALLLLCLSHRPDVVCGPLLIKALESQNFQASTIILAYAASNKALGNVQGQVCRLITCFPIAEHRRKLFTMLAGLGLLADSLALREELIKDVKSHHLPLIQILVDAGVSLDVEPHNAVDWVVSHMNLDILELFREGRFTSPVWPLLKSIPELVSEQEMSQVIEILAPKGLVGEPLDQHLVCAVRKQQTKLVHLLLGCGASVEFQQASAIQTALDRANLDILWMLLRRKCSPELLSSTLPRAIAVRPRSNRLQVIKAIAEKGVLKYDLGVAIQKLVCEDEDIDSELVKLLLQHQAPVDISNNDANNPVLVAVGRGNVAVLKMLCDAAPRNETLSKAIPVAFGVMHTGGYDVALIMIKLLLQQGVTGPPAHQTLLLAAGQDRRLDIVQLLVQHGADANYATGASYKVALKTANFKLLEMLCLWCPPSNSNMESILIAAIDPACYNLQSLELLLRSTSISAATLNFIASGTLLSNDHIAEIVACFLRHGLDVDVGEGVLLSSAVRARNFTLIDSVLSANPSIASLKTAFQGTSDVQPREAKLKTMRLLLEHANSGEIGQSLLVLQQTYVAVSGDLAGLQLLLHHNARLDLNEGMAVQTAAAAGALEVLDLMLSFKPSLSTITKACLAAASSIIGREQKKTVLERLLNANGGLQPADISALLADSIANCPDGVLLPQILLARRAKVPVATLKMALETSSRQVFMVLAGSIRSSASAARMFRYARKTTMDPTRRYWIYKYLLGRNIPSDDVSEALLDSLKSGELGDLAVPKLLLEHGAVVSYKKGAAFSRAISRNSLDAFKLLSQYLVEDSLANTIFNLTQRSTLLEPHVRTGIYRCLLQWNIKKASLYHVLLDSIKRGHSEISVVELLLGRGADPHDDNARCFITAAKMGAESTFRLLSKHAKLPVVLKALMSHFREESETVRWFRICLEEQTERAELEHHESLLACMVKFPNGVELLELLLNNGLSTSAETVLQEHQLCTGWQPELSTVLIWALFSAPQIGNATILLLLKRGGHKVLPAYSTPTTKTSAVLGCILDEKRTPILRELLNLDRDQVLDYKVPGSSLGYLGAHPATFDDESSFLDASHEFPLREACLYLGNFEAFRLLDRAETRNDTTLHLAALMALPRFVKWLLDFHDANHKAEEFDNMIPLALVCESKPNSWCMVANGESPWQTRQRETMRLLAAKTDLKWRHRGKTVLHFALENGPAATSSMVEALNYRTDPDRAEKYQYMDRDGVVYTPQQYITNFLDADAFDTRAQFASLAVASVTKFQAADAAATRSLFDVNLDNKSPRKLDLAHLFKPVLAPVAEHQPSAIWKHGPAMSAPRIRRDYSRHGLLPSLAVYEARARKVELEASSKQDREQAFSAARARRASRHQRRKLPSLRELEASATVKRELEPSTPVRMPTPRAPLPAERSLFGSPEQRRMLEAEIVAQLKSDAEEKKRIDKAIAADQKEREFSLAHPSAFDRWFNSPSSLNKYI